jgi:hypothetical protein
MKILKNDNYNPPHRWWPGRYRAEMVRDDKVVVNCEFWSSVHDFTPQEAGV